MGYSRASKLLLDMTAFQYDAIAGRPEHSMRQTSTAQKRRVIQQSAHNAVIGRGTTFEVVLPILVMQASCAAMLKQCNSAWLQLGQTQQQVMM